MSKKQIAFDLDTKALREYYQKGDWHNAYKDIKKFFEAAGFLGQQGSVYQSIKDKSSILCNEIIVQLVKEEPWLKLCMNDCVQTNIGSFSNMNEFFNIDNYYMRTYMRLY